MKDLGPIHTYTTPWIDTRCPEAPTKTTVLLMRFCEDCGTYVRPGPHICVVVPPGEAPLPSQEALAAPTAQPAPSPGDEAVVPLAIEYLQAKADAGEKKYGTQLETFNGRSMLLDALEDSADTFLYLYGACREKGLV